MGLSGPSINACVVWWQFDWFCYLTHHCNNYITKITHSLTTTIQHWQYTNALVFGISWLMTYVTCVDHNHCYFMSAELFKCGAGPHLLGMEHLFTKSSYTLPRRKQTNTTVILSQPSPPIWQSGARHRVISSSQICR